MKLFYLIGEPGAGKSTLIAKMTEGLIPYQERKPFGHTLWTSQQSAAYELGVRRPGGFGGTDSLSMSVQPKVLEWLGSPGRSYDVFGEGDRLANGKFFTGVSAMEIDLTVAYLEVPPELAEERRAKRAVELGTKSQDEKWVAGRRTKVLRLAEDWATIILKGDSREETLVAALRSQPVFKHLYETNGGSE
jgi:ABC-type cobalamin/Fe3+-siderophores transport system ATPase subunit